MGHNWVLVNTPDLTAVANAGMGAGLANNYVSRTTSACWRTPRSSAAVSRTRHLLDRHAQGGRRLLVPVHLPRSQRADARHVQVRLRAGRDTMDQRIADLLKLLELEQLEVNLFRGESRDIGSPQVFGGQVLGQALTAASATVEAAHRALAARLLPAPRRFQRADRLPGRSQPRWPQLLEPPRRRDSARRSRFST